MGRCFIMLVEVWCDKFKKEGNVRNPIRFHKGLNVVLGDDNGSNSIGKSTFLMILDFVFGGEDYLKRCVDVQNNVKEHTIYFSFDFDGNKYYFSRNTNNPNKIVRCDSKYQALPNLEMLSLDDYGKFLCEKYELPPEITKWRGAIAKFIRVYKRDTLDEEHPLMSNKNEPATDAIKGYMRLFDRYSTVEELIKKASDANEEKEAFRKSTQKYNNVIAAKSEKEKNFNTSKISELEQKEHELINNSDKGLLDLDSLTAQRLSVLNELLINYRRQRASIQAQLNSLRRDMVGQKRSFKKTFADLERFFPNEEFHTLEEIECFHQKLAKILDQEFVETEKNLTSTYALLDKEIISIQQQIAETKNIPNVSQAILKEYAEITAELNKLRQANANYDELQRLKQVATKYEEERDNVTTNELIAIEDMVNQQMRVMSSTILGDTSHMPPILKLEKISKYTFNTPNDGGTGAQYRGLITFDLANMSITRIPFVVHDSVLLKNIERSVFANIIKEYQQQGLAGKQVFLAYDTIDAYDEETRELIYANTVLELSPNGNELFGWAWNKEKHN